jgi:hypothetical protein
MCAEALKSDTITQANIVNNLFFEPVMPQQIRSEHTRYYHRLALMKYTEIYVDSKRNNTRCFHFVVKNINIVTKIR